MLKTRGFNRNQNPPPRHPVGDRSLPENGRESPKKNQQTPLNMPKPVNDVRQNLAREQTKNRNKIINENLDEEEDQTQQIPLNRTKPVNNIRQNLNRDAIQNLDQDRAQDLDL